jgi:excisionase family DNA binding protein
MSNQATAIDGQAFLTPAQAAELLQVSPKSIYRWATSDHTMPVFRKGAILRFPRERLLEWVTRQMPRGAR